MTIKKKLTVTKPSSPTASMQPPSMEGEVGAPNASAPVAATIADRFKLDAPVEAAKPKASVFALVAVIAAVLALAVSGFLTFLLYQHWTFLQGA